MARASSRITTRREALHLVAAAPIAAAIPFTALALTEPVAMAASVGGSGVSLRECVELLDAVADLTPEEIEECFAAARRA